MLLTESCACSVLLSSPSLPGRPRSAVNALFARQQKKTKKKKKFTANLPFLKTRLERRRPSCTRCFARLGSPSILAPARSSSRALEEIFRTSACIPTPRRPLRRGPSALAPIRAEPISCLREVPMRPGHPRAAICWLTNSRTPHSRSMALPVLSKGRNAAITTNQPRPNAGSTHAQRLTGPEESARRQVYISVCAGRPGCGG